MLTKQVATNPNLASVEPLNISSWLATSLLHKSIRRKRIDWALRAAATLFQSGPKRLRRRLCIIAFEDVGLANLDLVKASIAISYTDPSAVGELVSRMASSISCRAADDLFVVCKYWPALEPFRATLSNLSTPQILSTAGTLKDPIQKAFCVYSVLTSKGSRDKQQVFTWLQTQGLTPEIAQLCQRGYQATREPLCALLGLLWLYHPSDHSAPLSDPVPPEELVAGTPCWAYDIHVREGRMALRCLLEGATKTARWCRAHVPSGRVDFLGSVLFRIESGLVAKRLSWPLAAKLRQIADLECHDFDPHLASRISELLLNDLPHLNEERRNVVRS